MINLAVLAGELSSPPEIRLLDSGARLAHLQLRVPDGATATSIPVVVWDPPTLVEELDSGDPVVVVGRVRRRFFALPDGRRGARVEVVADTVARATDRRRVRAAVRRARARLDHGCER